MDDIRLPSAVDALFLASSLYRERINPRVGYRVYCELLRVNGDVFERTNLFTPIRVMLIEIGEHAREKAGSGKSGAEPQV